MTQFKCNKDGRIAEVINVMAAGMCSKTIGLTLVIYTYRDENLKYPFVMEHREFYKKHSEITK
jgi:hypothetical protein